MISSSSAIILVAMTIPPFLDVTPNFTARGVNNNIGTVRIVANTPFHVEGNVVLSNCDLKVVRPIDVTCDASYSGTGTPTIDLVAE